MSSSSPTTTTRYLPSVRSWKGFEHWDIYAVPMPMTYLDELRSEVIPCDIHGCEIEGSRIQSHLFTEALEWRDNELK